MPETIPRIRRVRRVERPVTRVNARVTSLGPKNSERADTSRQIDQQNEFTRAASALGAFPITPPYDPTVMHRIIEQSNMIKQCVAAMVTNVASGFEVGPIHPLIPVDPKEKEELESLIEFANADESLMTVHGKMVDDYEKLGYGYIEAIRDRLDRISLLRYVRASTIRLLPKDDELIAVQYDIARGPRVSRVTEKKRFRRFIQVIDGKTVWFKEWGDPRRLHCDTGRFETEGGERIPEDKLATELLHFRKQSEDPYGVPDWISQLPSVLGSREAEEVNLRYFEDNTVPPMILSVAGGRLTAESFNKLQQMLQQQSLGRDRQHKILLIEAVPERESLDDKGNVRLQVDKLSDTRQSDGLFKDYDTANQQKVRSSFRLPPVAVGLSQDVTFATANVSAFLAESQVYLPRRRIFDEQYNKTIVNGISGLGLKTCCLVSRVPAITNPAELMKSLTALNTMGALTPRMALEAANKILEIDLGSYPEKGEEGWEEWMDKPIIFVTRGTASQDGQAQKDEETKEVEEDGEVRKRQPENGNQ